MQASLSSIFIKITVWSTLYYWRGWKYGKGMGGGRVEIDARLINPVPCISNKICMKYV